MGYGLVPIIASVVLTSVYLILTDASQRSKILVFVIVATSIVIWRTMPQWTLVALLLQVGVSINDRFGPVELARDREQPIARFSLSIDPRHNDETQHRE